MYMYYEDRCVYVDRSDRSDKSDKNVCVYTLLMGTPAMPTSPTTRGWSESYPL